MESFRECGWNSFFSLGVGILATVLGAIALALALLRPRAGLLVGVLALVASLGAPGVGVLGMILGRQKTDVVSAGTWIVPEQRERLRVEGYREAALCVPVGATFGALPFVMAAIAIAVGAVRQKGEKKD